MFELLVSSPFDREYLVVEIWFERTMIAEINREDGAPRIEFYIKEGQSFDLAEFLGALKKGEEKI